jgi:hypothetical protein
MNRLDRMSFVTQSSVPEDAPRSEGFGKEEPIKMQTEWVPARKGSLTDEEQAAEHALLTQRILEAQRKQDLLDKVLHSAGVARQETL